MGNTVDVATVLSDENFQSLPLVEKNKVLRKIDPNFAALPPQEQQKALDVIQYGPRTPEKSTGKVMAREGALGLASGISGLPETQTPIRSAVSGQHSPWEALDPTGGAITSAVGAVKKVYGAGKEAVEGAVKGDPGEFAHGVGSLAGQGAQFALGAKKGPEAVDTPTSEGTVPKAARAAAHPIERLQGGPVKAGQEDIFRSTQPGAGSKDFNLRDNVSLATPDLVEIERKTPLNVKGGIIRPDLRLRQFATNVDAHLQDVWQQEVNPQIDRWGKAQVDMKPIKAAMRDTITQTDREISPSGVRAVEKMLDRMPDVDTLDGLNKRRKAFNAYLRDFESKAPSDKSAVTQTKPLVEAMKAGDKGIATQMFGELRRRGEVGIDQVEKRYAALSDLRDAARNQMNAAESFRLLNRLAAYINPRKIFGMHERISAEPTSGRLIQRGMKRLDRGTGETPQRAVTGESQPLPPPPNRMLPAPKPRLSAVPDTSGTVASTPPRVEPTTRATRKGLLLPAEGGTHTPMEPQAWDSEPGRAGGPNTKRPPIELKESSAPGTAITKRPGSTPTTSRPPSGKTFVGDPTTGAVLPSRVAEVPGPPAEVESHMSGLLRDGKISKGEIMRMQRIGVLPKGSAARIFKQAGVKGLPPPPL